VGAVGAMWVVERGEGGEGGGPGMDHGSMGAGGCAVSGSQPFTIVTEGASP
jgi:hypothetical protein